MDLSFTPEQIKFRQSAREWIQSAMPPTIRAKAAVDGSFDHEEQVEWHKILYKKGWVAPHWPKEFGGPGLDVTERFILSEELELAGAPTLSPFGLGMVGPLIIQFGNTAQKERFLPKILSGEEVWCQGYSEPNAGSDLASLKLRAESDGKGNYIMNGQKTWTTYAQYADWIFVLARTDASGKKQNGISFFLVDMKTPGVVAKPFLTTGNTLAFCETWFENAKVPAENIVGEPNMGWTYAKALLGHERTLVASVGRSTRQILRMKRIAAQTEINGQSALEHPGYRSRIARLEMDLEALRMANYRTVAGAQLGKAPGPESSILKLRGTEIQQECFELMMDIMGHHAINWFNATGTVPPREESVASEHNYLRAATIYAGSNEIQKNIIAKMVLGLPEHKPIDFQLTEDQRMLIETVKNFTKKDSPVERVRQIRESEVGWDKKVWRQMGELGWLGVPFPESVGGIGSTFLDAGLVVEQLGTTLVPEPYVPSVLVAGLTISHYGTEEQAQKLLGPMIEGKTSLALAYVEKASRYDVARCETRAEKDGGDYVLRGKKEWVLNGQAADHLLVSARTSGGAADAGGVSLFVVDRGAPGVKISTVNCMDSHKAAFVELDGVKVGRDALIGDEGAAVPILDRAQDYGAAASCCEGSGINQATLTMTREYMCEREQFGVKIGTFQALQHRLVDMFVQVELCRGTAILAMIRVDSDDEVERKRAISAAKKQLCTGGFFVTRQGIQLHGGIGVTDEHNVGLYFKRMHSLAALYGDEAHHIDRFGSLPSFTAGV